MEKAPRGVRLVIAIVGRRNAGKSSLINAIAGQDIAIVSDTPGTTTDPVAKPYELLPLGPVTFFDTAGLDDVGELGALRVKATRKILLRADLCILVCGEEGLGAPELKLLDDVKELAVPALVAANKSDLRPPRVEDVAVCRERGLRFLPVSARTGQGVDALKQALIDLAAPKGRLILPQVQVLRDILDRDAVGVVVKEREIA